MHTKNRFLETSERLAASTNRFNQRGTAQAQTIKKKQPITDAVVDSDTFVLDVLQFFFDERLQPEQLNESLRNLAAYALSEAINASEALDFVPRPPGMPPTVKWLVGQAVQIAFRRIQKEQGIYEIVRTTVKLKLRSEYEMAKMNLSGSQSNRGRQMGANNLRTSTQGLEIIKQFGGSSVLDAIEKVEEAINKGINIPLKQNQFDALVSLCSNIGIARFMASTLLKALNEQDHTKAAEEIRKWVKVEGKDDPELIRRRNTEAELFTSGNYSGARSVFQSYKAYHAALSMPPLSRQQNPAVVIAAAGLGWQILNGLINNKGDVSWNLSKMEGQKSPYDDEAKYKNKAVYDEKSFVVTQKTTSVGGILPMSADFEVKFKYNGYAIGFVSIQHLRNQDAMGWGLFVEATMMVDPNSYQRADGEPMAAVDLTFNYRFTTNIPFRDDDVWIVTYKLYGDGRVVTVSDKWTSPP